MKKIIALLISIVLLECNASFAVIGGGDSAPSLVDYSLAESVINVYSVHEETVYTVKKSVPLKSFSTNNYEYTLYELQPYGYAILLNETMDLMEACYEPNSSSPFAEEKGNVFFYAGPGIITPLTVLL